MKTKPVLTLYKKEIMDLLRDKKTIIVMILIPIFLYPTMLVISLFILQGVQRETQSRCMATAHQMRLSEKNTAFFLSRHYS